VSGSVERLGKVMGHVIGMAAMGKKIIGKKMGGMKHLLSINFLT
jgi:hypothetical protein